MMEISKTKFVKRYEPGYQDRVELVINNCSLEVESNGKAQSKP